MDVTQEVQRNHIVYGASDYTALHSLAGSKSLNYAKGPSLSRPDKELVTIVPHTLKYNGEVGLFGTENYFVRVQLDVVGDVVQACFAEVGWECAAIKNVDDSTADYITADIDRKGCLETLNTYECANLGNDSLPFIATGGYLSIELKNNKTGNPYKDDWLDMRLYTESREEHPYDKMYVKQRDAFYIGFHARNTRRLPINAACVIGVEYLTYDAIEDKKLIMRR